MGLCTVDHISHEQFDDNNSSNRCYSCHLFSVEWKNVLINIGKIMEARFSNHREGRSISGSLKFKNKHICYGNHIASMASTNFFKKPMN